MRFFLFVHSITRVSTFDKASICQESKLPRGQLGFCNIVRKNSPTCTRIRMPKSSEEMLI